MNSSLQNLTDIAADLNAAGKTVSIKRLPTQKARKADLVLTTGYRTTGVRVAGVKLRGGNGHNAGGKVG